MHVGRKESKVVIEYGSFILDNFTLDNGYGRIYISKKLSVFMKGGTISRNYAQGKDGSIPVAINGKIDAVSGVIYENISIYDRGVYIFQKASNFEDRIATKEPYVPP